MNFQLVDEFLRLLDSLGITRCISGYAKFPAAALGYKSPVQYKTELGLTTLMMLVLIAPVCVRQTYWNCLWTLFCWQFYYTKKYDNPLPEIAR